jgi:hypothetical protein
MLKGKEIIDSTGFNILKPTARSIPPTISVFIPPCKTSPEKRSWVKYSENA